MKEGEALTFVPEGDRFGVKQALALKMIKEKYRGSGKQAMVAVDVKTGKKCFVKVLLCSDIDQIYVEKESKVQLYSPFIIRIQGGMLDVGNRRFITVMDYVPEKDLSDLVRFEGICGETYRDKMYVKHTIALKFLYGIRHYMSVYSRDPIIHRDLKPENVLASGDGSVVKIIDFDWVHMHNSNETIMNRREQKGTPGYADPAFWNSFVAHPKMDIYSAGLVLYFLYTGMHHFQGTEEITRYMDEPDYAYTLKEMRGVDRELSDIIAKMIAHGDSRYDSIHEVIRDMEGYLESVAMLPEIPELLKEEPSDSIRLDYRIGDVRYSSYVKDHRFIAIDFGRKQERNLNGKMSAHVMSFYREKDQLRSVILHRDCHAVPEDGFEENHLYRDREIRSGDAWTYAGTRIEVLNIRRNQGET